MLAVFLLVFAAGMADLVLGTCCAELAQTHLVFANYYVPARLAAAALDMQQLLVAAAIAESVA